MADSDTIMRERQLAVRREMDRRSISLKAVSLDAQMSYSTIRSYFPGERNAVPAVMPLSALFTIAERKALPLELLSLLLPDGIQFIRAPEDIDHDALCDLARRYVDEKVRAHREDSPGGPAITDCERERLDSTVTQLRA